MCTVGSCQKPGRSKNGPCEMHYYRMRRHGDPDGFIPHKDRRYTWLKSDVGYYGAHKRVAAVQGAARERLCWCGNRAAHWSYNHADPNEMQSEMGPYSLDPLYYDPRCVSCHKKADLSWRRRHA